MFTFWSNEISEFPSFFTFGSMLESLLHVAVCIDSWFKLYFTARHKHQASSSKSSAHSPPPPPVNLQSPKPPSPIRAVKLEFQDQEIYKLEKFGKLLSGPNTDLGNVKTWYSKLTSRRVKIPKMQCNGIGKINFPK